MRKNLITLQLQYFLIISMLLCVCPVQAHFKECRKPIRLSSTSAWFPYIYKNKHGNSIGVDIELLTDILHRMGCKLRVVHFPERRMLYKPQQGNFDISLGASKNRARLKYFHYSTPYRTETIKFAYRLNEKDIFDETSLHDIVQLKKIIAINLAGWYGHELENEKARSKLFINSDTANKRLKMLTLKRVDIVIDDDIVLCNAIQRLAFNNVKVHPSVLSNAPIHFIFNKKSVSALFVYEFDKILNNMAESGTLSAHYNQYRPTHCSRHEVKHLGDMVY